MILPKLRPGTGVGDRKNLSLSIFIKASFNVLDLYAGLWQIENKL